jgi:hypothetical protein
MTLKTAEYKIGILEKKEIIIRKGSRKRVNE